MSDVTMSLKGNGIKPQCQGNNRRAKEKWLLIQILLPNTHGMLLKSHINLDETVGHLQYLGM